MVTSLTVNGSAVPATTLAAAGKMFNATGGSSGNTSTKISAFASGTNFKQIFALGTSTAQGNGVTSIPAPTDSNWHGWMWDVTTLEGNNILAGTWTPTFHLLASTGTTVTPTVQWFKRSSAGSYTSIGSVAGSSIALTTSSQLLIFTPPSLSSMNFTVGDKLVMWLWVNQTAGGATNSTISVVEATSASSAGVTSEAQAVTPGYSPTTVTKSTGVRTRIRSYGPSTGVYAATVLADKPLRYYHLNETSGTTATDASGNGQNGTLHGTVTLSQVGLIAQDSDTSMKFDGATGYISFPTTGLPTGAAPWSVECWLQISSQLHNFENPLNFGADVNNENAGFWFNTDNTINFGFHNGGNVVGPVISLNAPHHLLGTYDGTTLTFYVDGTSVGTPASTTGNLQYGGADIGTYVSTLVSFFPGTLDEPALYGTRLSATQVTNHYNAGTAPAKALSYPLRVPVRTQVTKSVGLRTVVSTSTLATKSSPVRIRVRTQVTKSLGLRALVRTQKTLSMGVRAVARTQHTLSTGMRTVVRGITKLTALRLPIRTQRTDSLSVRTRVRTSHTMMAALRTLIRTQVSKSTVLRALVRTQHTLSTPLRAVIRGITDVIGVRAPVRTQRALSAILRLRARTQKTLVAPLRTVIRTAHSLSTSLRVPVRTQKNLNVVFRTPVRNLRTLSTQLRVVVFTGVNLATKSSIMRVLVRTQKTTSLSLRTRIRSQVMKSIALRTIIRGITRITNMRVLVRTQRTTSTAMRALLRTQHSLTTTMRTRIRTQASHMTQLRAIIRGRTLLVAMRTRVRSQASRLLVLRVRVANNRMNTWLMLIRMPVRSQHTASAAIRIVCIQPNAVVLVRSGQAGAVVRSGQATAEVRSGKAKGVVRSGTASMEVTEPWQP